MKLFTTWHSGNEKTCQEQYVIVREVVNLYAGKKSEEKRSENHEFYETCHSVTFHFMKKDSKRCCDTTTHESIHTKDESKRGSAFAFIFGVN